jgi:hypothetical protein
MNKLAIISPFYKRHEVTALCFKRLLSQSKKYNVDVIVAGSEGEESKKLAKGLKYIETPNTPLGAKLNSLLSECKDYDGVIVLGSDDFISDSIIKLYQKIDTDKEVVYSFNDIYIYSSRLKKITSDFPFTRRGNGIGVGRLFSKQALIKCNYALWTPHYDKGLDGDLANRLKRHGIEEKILDLGNHFMLDVKVDLNITSHEIVNTGHKEHKLSIINKNFPRLGITKLKAQAQAQIRRIVEPKKEQKIMNKIRAIVLKPFNGHSKGDKLELKRHIIKPLIRAGFVEKLEQPIKKAVKKPIKKAVKKPVKKTVKKVVKKTKK